MNTVRGNIDLTDCDREPIHIIGSVQPFGALIALNADWMVAHASANCAKILGLDESPEPGTLLANIFLPEAIHALRAALSRIVEADGVERIFGLRLTKDGDKFDCTVHANGGKVVVEFEPHAERDYDNHLNIVGPMLAQLSPLRDLEKLCDAAARLVREVLGYDRVMVYRFHRDDSGEVVAEDHRDDLESFKGLRYPKTDIPAQARELFKRNRFRVIADVDDTPSPIEPEIGLDGQPLDLSLSVLRSSSPIHLQYLRNMGVGATLTIAIIRQDKLWGLFACHHYSPKLPPASLRSVADMISLMFSLMLDRLLIDHSERLRSEGRDLHDRLMLRLAGGTSLANELPMIEDALSGMIPHDGISVFVDGTYRSRGAAPTEQQFLAMAPRLGAAPTSTVLAEAAIAEAIPAAADFADVAAGALILTISRSPRDYLVLWRRPLSQTVRWAGNPAKAVTPGVDRLEPRSSFAEWATTVEGQSDEWTDDELTIANMLRVTLLEVVLRMTDEVARERKKAQEQQELLIAELNHRVRNILNLIRSLVSQSQDDAKSVSSFAKIIGGRIGALASAHDNITKENWSPAPLANLFETEVAAYIGEKQGRFHLTGAKVLIKPEAYTVLALVIHEMVTNSAKYGSLCDSSGRLDVAVSLTRGGNMRLEWRESGGPAVQPPKRRGFGSTIIERSIPYELGGEAETRFKLSGFEADFEIPARYIEAVETAEEDDKPAASAAHGEDGPIDIASAEANMHKTAAGIPKHVLVVEDSMIIALDTEENLKRLGVGSVQIESTVAGALQSIEERRPDFALVDYNLGSETSTPVAQELARLGTRFVLATGYSEIAGEAEKLGADGVVRKPYGLEEIKDMLKPKD